MANVNVIDDEVLKDNLGNGKLTLIIEKNKFLGGKIRYEFDIFRKEELNISGCTFKKIKNGGDKKYIFELCFDKNTPSNNKVTYKIVNGMAEKAYDVLGNDVMFNAKIRAEENKILKEFDELMWFSVNHSQSKSTLIDVITDVIDVTERDDAVINDVKVTDADLIHMAIRGYFGEVNTNVEKVEF